MQSFTLHNQAGQAVEFEGSILGASTSEARSHNHPGDFLVPTQTRPGERRAKCSACRWLETTIYLASDDSFVVHTVGRSIVPGEQDYHRLTFTKSGYEVVEVLTVKSGPEPFIPLPSARALAQAADRDDLIQDAYVNRAVFR